ncbi:MAG TPA: ribonuclease D [Rhodospirillales bacterium]|nr:ribonuclease D [Rhodospirillales bacterium]
MKPITDTRALEDFCASLGEPPYITIDTEFMREKTYWPILCLVQVAAGGGGNDGPYAAIDPLAPGMDLTPLFDVLANKNILKVFHAARQDLEIFQYLAGRLPEPVFDTQVAAMVCGFGDSVGYESLIAKLTKQRIDKSSRFTDWSHRPLSERQITYALADVTHLRPAYEKLKRTLESNGRAGWLDEEMAILTDPKTYTPDPNKVFRRIKSRSNDRRYLAVLREVAAWREHKARDRNIPRNRVLRDEELVEIAHHTPSNSGELSRTRGLSKGFAEGSSGAAILDAVRDGLAVPEKDRPEPVLKPDLPRGLGPATDLLKVLLKMKCEERGVAQKLLASSADLDQIAAYGEKAQVRTLNGWRRELFGEDALKLVRGEICLSLKNGKTALIES